jgi:hypothetical protein
MDKKNALIELIKGFNETQIKQFLDAAIVSPQVSEEDKNKFREIISTFLFS